MPTYGDDAWMSAFRRKADVPLFAPDFRS